MLVSHTKDMIKTLLLRVHQHGCHEVSQKHYTFPLQSTFNLLFLLFCLQGACSKVNLMKEHTTSQVKNLTASAVNDIISVPGKLINLGMNCMPDIVTKNCLATSSMEYFSELISIMKNLPCVSVASEGLSHFTEYLSVSWPASFDEAASLPEINVVLVEEDDIHFIPPLPGRRHHFAVFVGQR